MKKGFIETGVLIAIGALILSGIVSVGWYSDHKELVDYRNELSSNLLGSVTSTALSDTIGQFRINANDNFAYLDARTGNAVSSSTAVNTGLGLYGGGNLTADRTIAIVTSTYQTIFSGVSSSTQVIAGSNLTGGGALTTNVTLNVTTTPTFTSVSSTNIAATSSLTIPFSANPTISSGTIGIDTTNNQFLAGTNIGTLTLDGQGRGHALFFAATTSDIGVLLDRPLASTTITQVWCKTSHGTTTIAVKNNGITFASTTCSVAGQASSSLNSVLTGGGLLTFDNQTMTIADSTSTLDIFWYGTKLRQ